MNSPFASPLAARRGQPGLVGPLVPLLACLLVAPGCWVAASEGERMNAAAAARDARLDGLERQTKQRRDELDIKVAELETLIEQATRIVQRSSADVGAQVDTMRGQIAALEGQLAELRHELETYQRDEAEKRAELEQRLAGGGASVAPASIPADKVEHFKLAYDRFAAGAYAEARGLFKAYLERYATDAKAGSAQYWVAATYLQESKPATALGEYQKVISQHAKSSAVNVSLYGMADAFYRLHACTDAKAAITALLKRRPKSDLSSRAKALLSTIRKAGRTYCTS